jgi:hypothetical protein
VKDLLDLFKEAEEEILGIKKHIKKDPTLIEGPREYEWERLIRDVGRKNKKDKKNNKDKKDKKDKKDDKDDKENKGNKEDKD